MLSNNLIQEALVSKLKASAALVAALSASSSIKEDQWQGRAFSYPAIRVALGAQTPVVPKCPLVRIPFSVLCYSEKASSNESNTLANLVYNTLGDKSFCLAGVKFVFIGVDKINPAVREDERTWKISVDFLALAQPS